MHTFIIAFLIVWLTGVGVAAVSAISSFAEDFIASPSQALNETSGFTFIPVGMLAFGIVLASFGRYIARGESLFLIAFLRDTLEAEPA